MAGLYIEHQRDYHIGRWLFVAAFAGLIAATGWFGYIWFTTGERPPIVPLPASALADPSIDENPVSQSVIDSYSVEKSHPRFISIPALSISNARVRSVGLTKTFTLDTPKSIHDAAWYNKSGLPGQGYGAVLINGHNNGISKNGVFANLNKLKEGDEIIIERGDGKKIIYTVVESRVESIEEANTTGIKRLLTPYNADKEGLGLITTSGNWIPRDKVFDKRILVRAVVQQSDQDTQALNDEE